MKTLLVPFALTAIATLQASVSAQEAATQKLPTAKQIIERNIEATASQAALDSLKTLVAEGTIAIPQVGLTGDMKVYQSIDGRAAVKITLPGIGDQQIGTDGKVIWEMSQITGAEILEGERAVQAKLQLSLNALSHYEDFFDKMECTGIEEFEGTECYVLKSQKGDFDPVVDYFSVESGLQVGSKLKAATAAGKMEIVSVISDYKSVGDFTMPHKTVSKLPNGMTQEVTVKSMRMNVDIPEGAFDVPDDVQALLKKE
jgi:hypothetical protein